MSEQQAFTIGDTVVKESNEEKLLGVWVSNDLNWSKHIDELEDKLRRLEQSIPKSLLKKVADGIFNSIL